jgi:hypothetical protein
MRLSPALLLSLMMLGAGGATLATGFNWEPDLEITRIAPVPVPQPVKTAGTSTPQDAALLQTLNERPPFTPGRRPPQPETPAVAETAKAQAVPDLPVPTVRGIALSGQSSVAIVALGFESNRLHRIALGGEIAGWRVTDIQRESVTFSNATIAAKAYLGKPGEEPRVETTRHDAELAEKKDTDTTRLSPDRHM